MPEQDERPRLYALLAHYSSLLFLLPACLLLGLVLGRLLDGYLSTSPWLTAVGLLLGLAAGFLQLFRTIGSGRRKP